MITLFTAPKAFRGKIEMIQKNAIQSWLHLSPDCEVLLMGNDEGIADAARELGVRNVPDVGTNEIGTPLVSSLFETAERLARHDLLGYVNGDMLFLDDLLQATRLIADHYPRFLLVGQRMDLEVEGPLEFEKGWDVRLRALAQERGRLHEPEAIDYFIFRRGQWGQIPRFAIGRAGWDNWMIYRAARSLKIPVITATHDVLAIHQNHDYSHHPQGQQGVWQGIEAERNRALAGGYRHILTLEDATHELVDGKIRRRPVLERLRRELQRRHIAARISRLWRSPLRVLNRLTMRGKEDSADG